jgi:uncharacterized repeat protein (TIGR03803 family)
MKLSNLSYEQVRLLNLRSAAFVVLTSLITSVPVAAQTLTTVASFNGSNGVGPAGGVVFDSAGNLYGVTGRGGAHGDGTVFEIAKGSSSITTLAAFNGTNGINPQGLTLDAAGNLYGIAASGAFGYGTVFEVTKGSNSITTLAAFNTANEGVSAGSLAIDAAGNLYGQTAGNGGTNPNGTVYEVAKGSGSITTLAAFNGTNGAGPVGGLTLDAAGNLYGTANLGGAIGWGTVYEIVKGSNTITALASFNGANGSRPESAPIFDSAGNLYGTTTSGGPNNAGTLFEIVNGSGVITPLANFSFSSAAMPVGPLTFDAVGNLYGTTIDGPNGWGTAFELAAGSSVITTLAIFNVTNGAEPYGGVTFDAAGNLYGTTEIGGQFGDGTVFEISPASVVPEPSSMLLLSLGLGGGLVAGHAQRRRSGRDADR